VSSKIKTNYDFKIILSEIPSNIKYSIAADIFEGRIYDIHIFKDCSKNFISNICPLLQSCYVSKDHHIYLVDEVPEYSIIVYINPLVYFIIEGSVAFATYDLISFTKLSKGSYFGEIEILRKTYR
jgi:hypothetical protein